MSLKPRMILRQAALILQMPVEDIPYGAFRAWLGRYRKANGVPQKKDMKKALPEKAAPKKERKNMRDWMDFVPTPISEMRKKEEPLFKRVVYSDDDIEEG